MIPDKIRKYVVHYLFGLFTSSWNGAISAIAGILAIDGASLTGADAIVDGTHQSARVLNFHEMISAFVGSFALHAFFYFKSHPLPETLETTAPFPLNSNSNPNP